MATICSCHQKKKEYLTMMLRPTHLPPAITNRYCIGSKEPAERLFSLEQDSVFDLKTILVTPYYHQKAYFVIPWKHVGFLTISKNLALQLPTNKLIHIFCILCCISHFLSAPKALKMDLQS